MSETNIPLKGHCLCGAVHLSLNAATNHVGACHCTMCRRWAGGPSLAIESERNATFEGEENITVYRSSDWAERGFCKKCGSHLFYRMLDHSFYSFPVGLFEETTPLNFEMQVFIEEKPAYYSFANATKTMTGAELFSLFS